MRSVYATIAAITFFIGVLFVPVDIIDSPDAVSEWMRYFSLIDREKALILFSALLVAWIAWNDFRPYFRRLIGHHEYLHQPEWKPRAARFMPIRRILFPVTFEFDEQVLLVNAPSSSDFVKITVYAFTLRARNNRNKEIKNIKGHIQLEKSKKKIPIFVTANGESRENEGIYNVYPYEEFEIHASFDEPAGNRLICSNKINDALFLRDYSPFTLAIQYNGKEIVHNYLYSRINEEIDRQRDRIFFYDQNKCI